ncbi:MAG: hypothetical protein LQ342_005131 [Letrouitia transgressa]|nr:MAG: hypothetical protein LQ342_005131 [Letrouitia transgressa]
MSLVDPAAAAKLLPKKDKSSGPLKMKKSIAKKTKPKESDSKTATRSTSPETPSISGNGTELRASAPVSQPVGDSAEQVRCKHCKRSMAKSVAASHIKTCQEKKKERAQKKKEEKESKEAAQREKEGKDIDKDKEVLTEDLNAVIAGGEEGANSAKNIIKSAKKSAAKATAPGDGSSKKTKKRKADAEGDKEPKKKKLKKDEPAKAKVPKPKGPVDVEKQCGVLLPNGGYCARSLTCKSHSMGAKRSVPGRSLPYDILLAQYQKKNQAKQQSTLPFDPLFYENSAAQDPSKVCLPMALSDF